MFRICPIFYSRGKTFFFLVVVLQTSILDLGNAIQDEEWRGKEGYLENQHLHIKDKRKEGGQQEGMSLSMEREENREQMSPC